MVFARRFGSILEVSVEVNPVVGEFGPRGNLFLVRETERLPALSLGTSSDRLGTKKGMQSYYATASKTVTPLRMAPYVSLNWSETDDGFNVPFGANVYFGKRFTLLAMYDGHYTHLVPSRSWGAWTTSIVLARMEYWGVTVGVEF